MINSFQWQNTKAFLVDWLYLSVLWNNAAVGFFILLFVICFVKVCIDFLSVWSINIKYIKHRINIAELFYAQFYPPPLGFFFFEGGVGVSSSALEAWLLLATLGQPSVSSWVQSPRMLCCLAPLEPGDYARPDSAVLRWDDSRLHLVMLGDHVLPRI